MTILKPILAPVFLACWILAVIPFASGGEPENEGAYTLPRTHVKTLKARANGVNYKLYISLPRNYGNSTARYPVVYLLDADYSFAIARNITEHLADRADLPKLLLVAIAYPDADSSIANYRVNRMRDYTPTFSLKGGYGKHINRHSGGGPDFRQFLEKELIPHINGAYRTKTASNTLVGHSMGGMFAHYMMFERSAFFSNYIIVSPSLWWDGYLGQRIELNYSKENSALPVSAYYAVGSLEEEPMRPMVSSMTGMTERIGSRKYQGLRLKSQVFAGETHNTVFPVALTHGLAFIFASQ